MRLLIIFALFFVNIAFAQFQQYCSVGCVRSITYWQNVNTTWPSGYPKTTTICGTTVETILDAYSFVDCSSSSPLSILGHYIWAQLNAGSGACRTTTSQNAINNIIYECILCYSINNEMNNYSHYFFNYPAALACGRGIWIEMI